MDAVSALTSIRAGFEAGPAAHPTQPTWVVQELSVVAGVASGEPIPGVKDGVFECEVINSRAAQLTGNEGIPRECPGGGGP